MSVQVRIRRLNGRVRARAASDPSAELRRAQAVAHGRLPGLLDALLPEALASAGVPLDSEIAIRRLALRLRLRGDVPDGRIASAWARALAELIAQQVGSLLTQGGGSRGEVAAFPDRVTAELSFLHARLRAQQDPWWSADLLGDGAASPQPHKMITRWIDRFPEQVPRLVLQLVRVGPLHRLRLDGAAQKLTAHLLEAWRRRWDEVLGPPPSDTGSLLVAVAPTEAMQVHPRATGVSDVDRLVATCSALANGVRPPSLRAQDPWIDSRRPPVGDHGVVPRHAAGLDVDVVRHAVGCGGLLFLIRPASQLPLVREASGASVNQLLAAIACRLLDRVLAPLGSAARCAALRRDQPLVDVFSGVRDLPRDLDELVVDADLSERADKGVDALLERLPEVAAVPNGIGFTLGQQPEPLPSDGVVRRLANLILRPGGLTRGDAEADLYLGRASADVGIRLRGWDFDPGWVPHLGRTVRFHYQEASP